MITLEISGIIKFVSDYPHDKIKLVQEVGYELDLILRFKEAHDNYPKKDCQVSYWLSDTLKSKEEMLEGFLAKLYGAIDADYKSEDYSYSSWTSGTDYSSDLIIGGHNLFSELRSEDGRYILIELSFK